MAGDDASPLEGSMDNPPSHRKMPKDEFSCTSSMANIFVRKKGYGPNHPHQMDHEDHLVIMISQAYTPLLLVEG